MKQKNKAREKPTDSTPFGIRFSREELIAEAVLEGILIREHSSGIATSTPDSSNPDSGLRNYPCGHGE